MMRTGVNILLLGFLMMGLSGAAYLLLMVVPSDLLPIEVFEAGVLFCWGTGAVLVVGGAAIAELGKMMPHR